MVGGGKGFIDTVIIVTSVFWTRARAQEKKLLFKYYIYILYYHNNVVCPVAGTARYDGEKNKRFRYIY